MSEPFLGQIYLVGYNFAQRGFAFAQGQLLPISQNSALFSLFGTIYGGDGRTNFALPDLRGRCALGLGQGPGLSNRRIGEKGGTETNTQTIANMAAHNHEVQATNQNATNGGPGDKFLAAREVAGSGPKMYHNGPPNKIMNPAMITETGDGQAINNMQPFLVLNYEVALQGVFPSRN